MTQRTYVTLYFYILHRKCFFPVFKDVQDSVITVKQKMAAAPPS
jgi:hypothetical protein